MTPPRRPPAVIAHLGGLRFFGRSEMVRLAEVATILDAEPIGTWDDPRAEALLADAEVVIGHWGCPALDATMLERAPHLALVAYAAGTVKRVVTPAVFARGIRVTSGARANAEPVAEFTLAAILFAGKDVLWRRSGATDAPPMAPVGRGGVRPGNWGRTIGIIGASLVGRRVIELLRPFPALTVSVYDPFLSAAEAAELGVAKVDLDELCRTADVLSIHAPDLPSTRHLVAGPQLGALRDGATVINTARGALVDHEALAAEAQSGRLRAILDVTDPEPLPDDHLLRRLPNVFLTPHLAGSEGTELRRMSADVAEEVRRWAAGDPALNEVRLDHLDRMA